MQSDPYLLINMRFLKIHGNKITPLGLKGIKHDYIFFKDLFWCHVSSSDTQFILG